MDAPVLVRCCRALLPRTHRRVNTLLFNSEQLKLLSSSSRARNFSTATQTQTTSARHVFRTSEDDPRKHTLDHVGLYYNVPQQEINGLLKNCIHPWYMRLMKTFNESCFMVRKPALELYSYLNNVKMDHPVVRFALYGHRGAGKKFVMHHTVQCCHRDNWIIVNVPWAGEWARGFRKEKTESTHKPGRYDLPTDGAEWLSHFRTQNQGKLHDFKTTAEYVWTKREKAEAGTPIEEIINFGLSRIKFSCDCVGVILKELRQQAETKQLKVLVAVSAVNAFYVPWNQKNVLTNAEKRIILPGEVSLIHNFKKMISPTWNHGAVICTVEDSANVSDIRESYTPKYLLCQEGFEALDPFVPILVEEYTEKEALSNVEYFIDRNWIQNKHGRTEEGKKEIIFVSNRNPHHLLKVCSAL